MPENSEVLDFLRARFARQDERLDRMEGKLDEVSTRLGAVERDVEGLHDGLAALRVDLASMQGRLDGIDRWLGRVERRIELVEVM
jgi:archaellum component FlaC